MVEAIESVRREVRRPRRKPQIRRVVLIAALLALLVAAWRIGPAPLYEWAAASLPETVRANMDDEILVFMEARAGEACAAEPGAEVLAALAEDVLGEGRRAAILPDWSGATELPGGLVVVGREAVEGIDDPAAAAGWLLAADLTPDPAALFLSEAGIGATGTLMSTGTPPREAMDEHAARLLASEVPSEAAALAQRFEAAGISAAPFAAARGDAVLAALDPHGGTGRTPLGDGEWIALRDICR